MHSLREHQITVILSFQFDSLLSGYLFVHHSLSVVVDVIIIFCVLVRISICRKQWQRQKKSEAKLKPNESAWVGSETVENLVPLCMCHIRFHIHSFSLYFVYIGREATVQWHKLTVRHFLYVFVSLQNFLSQKECQEVNIFISFCRQFEFFAIRFDDLIIVWCIHSKCAFQRLNEMKAEDSKRECKKN